MATKPAAMPAAPMPDPADAVPSPDVDVAAPDGSSQTLVTITKESDGTYIVYAGAEAGVGGEAAPKGESAQGIPCNSIGKALKAAMDILQADESQGDGTANENFSAGFEGGSAASPKRATSAAAKY